MRTKRIAVWSAASLAVVLLGSGCSGLNPTAGNPGPVTLSMSAPEAVRVGGVVPVTMRLTNTAQEEVHFYHGAPFLNDVLLFNVIVTLPSGTEVWNRLHVRGGGRLSVVYSRILAAGERIELSDIWDLRNNEGEPVAPGVYHVRGVIPGTVPQDLTTDPKTVTVTP